MNRSTLAEFGESVGDVVSTGTSTLGDLATTAVTRTGELASSAIEHVAEVPERLGELAKERFAPPPRRSRTPWFVLVLAAAVGAALVWWFRRERVEPVAPTRPTTIESDRDDPTTLPAGTA